MLKEKSTPMILYQVRNKDKKNFYEGPGEMAQW